MNILQEHLGKKINLKNIHVYVQSKYCWLHLLNIQKFYQTWQIDNLLSYNFLNNLWHSIIEHAVNLCRIFMIYEYNLCMKVPIRRQTLTTIGKINNQQKQQSAITRISKRWRGSLSWPFWASDVIFKFSRKRHILCTVNSSHIWVLYVEIERLINH